MISKRIFAVALLLCVAWSGCLFTPNKEEPKADVGNYAEDLSVPDSLIHNLLEAYPRRNIDEYAKLLARDYKFEFQEPDQDFPDGMNFTQDSTSTRNMFDARSVTTIDLSFTAKSPIAAKYEGEDTKVIEISNLLLSINQDNGVTLRVDGDVQEYHMVLGDEADGEDPTRYYIRAWLDIGGAGAAGPPVLAPPVKDEDGRVIYHVTMSELHKLFYGS